VLQARERQDWQVSRIRPSLGPREVELQVLIRGGGLPRRPRPKSEINLKKGPRAGSVLGPFSLARFFLSRTWAATVSSPATSAPRHDQHDELSNGNALNSPEMVDLGRILGECASNRGANHVPGKARAPRAAPPSPRRGFGPQCTSSIWCFHWGAHCPAGRPAIHPAGSWSRSYGWSSPTLLIIPSPNRIDQLGLDPREPVADGDRQTRRLAVCGSVSPLMRSGLQRGASPIVG